MQQTDITQKIIDYVNELLEDSRSIGIVLFACTIISLILANTNIGDRYVHFFLHETKWTESFHLPKNIKHWINDGLMAVFFFLVGMEIKRELLKGELSSVRRALLPVGAAVGGMIIPAFIFAVFNRGTAFGSGWGITVATDIAFSLAVASLMGDRFPRNLKLFLMALSIIDDLGAILILAIFYGASIKGWWVTASLICLGLLFILNLKKVRFGWFHFLLGLMTWYCVYNSGIHSTIAGVLFAFMIPVDQLSRLENKIHHFVYFGIMPLFAVANTAIIFTSTMFNDMFSTLSIGIFLGLFVGKPAGVLLGSWLLVRKKLARLPKRVSWKQMAGAGILAGIGFTMSIFMSALAYENERIQDMAKIAIMISMLFSVAVGVAWIKYFSANPTSKKLRLSASKS